MGEQEPGVGDVVRLVEFGWTGDLALVTEVDRETHAMPLWTIVMPSGIAHVYPLSAFARVPKDEQDAAKAFFEVQQETWGART